MAKCNWCHKEMTDSKTGSCVGNKFVEFPDGTRLPSVLYLPELLGERCHDCNIAAGGQHHPGCDMERCPKCGGQLISCGCLDEVDPEEETQIAIDTVLLDDVFGEDAE